MACNPGPQWTAHDNTTSAQMTSTILVPLAGLSNVVLFHFQRLVQTAATNARTTLIDRTRDPQQILVNSIAPKARLLKASPSELYILNMLEMMPLLRFFKALPSWQTIQLPSKKHAYAIRHADDVKTFLDILKALKIQTDLRTS